MAKILCKYHPSSPARWVCEKCQINFCNTCIKRDKAKGMPICPVCGETAGSLGAGNLIKPFWQRIPSFFLYPGHLGPMVFMIFLAIVGTVLGASIFGFLIQLVISIVFMKYAFVVLEDTAHGHLKPQTISSETLTSELELPFKQILLFLYMAIVNFVIWDYLGQFFAIISVLLTILALPASVMVLAIEHSFFKAINPLVVAVTIARIGWSYLILYFFLLLLSGASVQATILAANVLPEWSIGLMANFFGMYFTLSMYNMMGYVLYQYHEDLGFDIAREYEESDITGNENPEFSEIEILLKEGKIDDAEKLLISKIQHNPAELGFREKLHRLYIKTHNSGGAQKHSAEYITRLFHDNKMSDAQRVFLEAYQLDNKFKLNLAKERYEMARLLKANGQSRAALSQLNNLHIDHPSYEGVPAAYLLAAEIMFEYFGEEDKAVQILNFVLKKYPGHQLKDEIISYQTTIKNVAANS